MLEKFQQIKDACQGQFRSFEMWPSYFERRHTEFLSYYEILGPRRFSKTLELGCSIGYHSAFLSQFSEEVIATDRARSEIGIHQGNLEKARNLLQGLGIRNVKVQEMGAEQLSFPDNTFDLVFSSHVFGYIKDQRRALSEIYRVLKPGGIHFCVVPARASTLIRIIEYYFYLLNRGVFHLGRKLRLNNLGVSQTGMGGARPVKRKIGSRLLPQTQGSQRTWMEEVHRTSFRKWNELIFTEGKLKPILQVATQVNPLLPLGSIYFPVAAARWYHRFWRLEAALGRLTSLQAVGLNSVLVGEKI